MSFCKRVWPLAAVHRLAVDHCGPCRTPVNLSYVDLFLRHRLSTIIMLFMLEIESADVHLLSSAKEWTLPTCQKNRECNTPQERFPRLWNYLGWPAAVHVTAQYLEWHYWPQHVGVKGFFTLIIAVEDPSRLSRWWSLPPWDHWASLHLNQNTEIPRDQLDEVKKHMSRV